MIPANQVAAAVAAPVPLTLAQLSPNQQNFLMLKKLGVAFLDWKQLLQDFDALYKGRDIDDPEFAGVGVGLVDLYQADVESFCKAIEDPHSEFFLLRNAVGRVDDYLKYFDVTPNGPDVLKYALAFGCALEKYLEHHGQRPMIGALVRMRTLHILRVLSGLHCPRKVVPPRVMFDKIRKVWRHGDEDKLLGLHGTYMVFKTWSLA